MYGGTEPVGYDGGACYLAEVGDLSELRSRTEQPVPAPDARAAALGAMRARHASDGDILAPPHRPESGAFSGDDSHFQGSSCRNTVVSELEITMLIID